MAMAISNIPVLTGEVAAEFVRRAEDASRNRGRVDFSRQRAEWRDFDRINQQRIEAMRASGKWPF